MIRLLAILLLPLAAHAAKVSPLNGWIACDINGKSVPLYRDAGDSITCDVPRYYNVVSFLTHSTGSLTGKTISLTFYVEASPDIVWTGGNPNGCPEWPNLQLYFTSVDGPFNFNNSHRYSRRYWWHGPTRQAIEPLDGGAIVTLTATTNPADWSGAWGSRENGAIYPADFATAAATAKQVGLAFGNGCSGDTGIATTAGSATIHVLSLTIQ